MEYRYIGVDRSTGTVVAFSHTIFDSTDSIDVFEVPLSTTPAGVFTAKYINNNVVFNMQDKTREQKIAELDVTTSTGKVFDGDEKSQDRMLRAISIANISGQTETQWKMADNSVQTVTLEELQEALTLAGQEMSRIWVEG